MQTQYKVNQQNLDKFLEKHKDLIKKNVTKAEIKAEIFTDSQEDLIAAAQKIKNGQLVAFPTETVYGLGASALNPEAIKQIFNVKRRPLSDPVIVHVLDKAQAKLYVKLDSQSENIFNILADSFWPGPLTMVVKGDFSKISKILTAQTEYVGVRAPKTLVSRKLIELSGVPIAAPSANLFSHVSPTTSVHVFNDFYDQMISIVDGQQSDFGVESTVVKIMPKELLVFRFGSISLEQLEVVLKKNNLSEIKVTPVQKKQENTTENQEAPGQLIKHYSPNLLSFQYSFTQLQSTDVLKQLNQNKSIDMKQCIVLDFLGQTKVLQEYCLKYVDMHIESSSDCEKMKCIMKNLYDLLRWAENFEGAKYILLNDVKEYYTKINIKPEFLETVSDKIFRSTSGKKIFVYMTPNKQIYLADNQLSN